MTDKYAGGKVKIRKFLSDERMIERFFRGVNLHRERAFARTGVSSAFDAHDVQKIKQDTHKL